MYRATGRAFLGCHPVRQIRSAAKPRAAVRTEGEQVHADASVSVALCVGSGHRRHGGYRASLGWTRARRRHLVSQNGYELQVIGRCAPRADAHAHPYILVKQRPLVNGTLDFQNVRSILEAMAYGKSVAHCLQRSPAMLTGNGFSTASPAPVALIARARPE